MHLRSYVTVAPQVPGNIRRAEHFLAFLKRFINYLKGRMGVQQVESETPHSFLGHLQTQVAIDGVFLPPKYYMCSSASRHLHCLICTHVQVAQGIAGMMHPALSDGAHL